MLKKIPKIEIRFSWYCSRRSYIVTLPKIEKEFIPDKLHNIKEFFELAEH